MPTLNIHVITTSKKTYLGLLATLMLGLSTVAPTAHAEQFCKSVDATGATSYVLAPPTGCNKKKYTPVSVSHHITPQPTPAVTAASAPAATSASAPAATTAAPQAAGTATPAPSTTAVTTTTTVTSTTSTPPLNNAPIASAKGTANKF